jgi:hypothetical protein
MGVAYYNNKRGISQYKGVLTRPAVGLNEYTPANAINENYMSDSIDVDGYREEAIKFHNITTVSKKFDTQAVNKGRVVAIMDSELSDYSDLDVYFYGMSILTTGWKLFIAAYHSVGVSTLTEYSMTIPSTPTYDVATFIRYSKTIFRTESDVFYCFTADSYTRLHYLKYNYAQSTNTYGYVDLPFYPASIVSHANRIFAIDTRNKLWWCRAGDLFSWYGLEYDDNMLVTSANMKNGTHTLAGSVDTPRVVTATCTKTDTIDTLGILTITGTNSNGDAQKAVLTLYEGRVQTPEVFATVTSIVQSGWTQGGATPDTIEVGVGPVGSGFVQDDSGYWTLEGEPYVFELFTLSNVLYISAGVSIYAFRGYSYETFSLQRLVSNLGNPSGALFGYRQVAVIRNKAFFISGADVYEFDGDSAPKIISRPVYLNNALTNGIMGGIDLTKNFTLSNWVLEADTNSLYVYTKQASPTLYYRFDFQTRTWWKFSGWSNTSFSSTNSVYVRFVPKFSNDDFVPFFWEHASSGEDDFWMVYGDGDNGVTQGTVYPFIITKSYQTNPSEVGTLTAVILAIKGTANKTADITLAYNNTENGTTFTTIKAYANKVFTGDMEILEIPLIGSEIANQHHYRLKITIADVSDYPVYLYNFERRFRVRGYSR